MRPVALAWALLLALLAAPLEAARIERFSVEADARVARLDADLELALSGEMLRALEHGIVLPLRLELRAYGDGRRAQARSVQRIELGFQPLTGRYRVAAPSLGYQRSYARRGQMIASLEQLRGWPLEAQPWPPAQPPKRWRMRLTLDRGALPAPLRLPALLDAEWALDSGWIEWIVAPS